MRCGIDECRKKIRPGDERMRLPTEKGDVTICIACAKELFTKVIREDFGGEVKE